MMKSDNECEEDNKICCDSWITCVKYLKFKTAGYDKLLYQLITCYKFNSTHRLMDTAQAEMTHSLKASALIFLQVIKPESSKM
jgi:hypothetical protein